MPSILTRQYGPLPVWGWAIVGVGGVFVWRFMRNSGGNSSAALVPVDTQIPTTTTAGGSGGGGSGGTGASSTSAADVLDWLRQNTPGATQAGSGGAGGAGTGGSGNGSGAGSGAGSGGPATGGAAGSWQAFLDWLANLRTTGGNTGPGAIPGGPHEPGPLAGGTMQPAGGGGVLAGALSNPYAAGEATVTAANTYWSAISAAIAALPGGAKVAALFPGNANVQHSASPEQFATAAQYEGLTLNQYPGVGTGIYAPGAPIDITRGLNATDIQMQINWLKSIQASGAYNKNVPAIGNATNVASLIYSLQDELNSGKFGTPAASTIDKTVNTTPVTGGATLQQIAAAPPAISTAVYSGAFPVTAAPTTALPNYSPLLSGVVTRSLEAGAPAGAARALIPTTRPITNAPIPIH